MVISEDWILDVFFPKHFQRINYTLSAPLLISETNRNVDYMNIETIAPDFEK